MKPLWASMDLFVGLNEVPYADILVASELDEDAEQWLDAVGPLSRMEL